jgi:carbon monoxide dehydrogenase subunit G
VILDISPERAWAALSALPPARGTVAGYSGLVRVEELDDDTHTAVLRLAGTGPHGPATATITATLEAVPNGTRLHFSTRAHPRPDAQAIHTITATLAAALTAPGAPARLIPARLG